MVAPVLQREGVTVGGLTDTQVAFSYRTDSNGVNASVDISSSPNFINSEGTIVNGVLSAGNNYQAAVYVSGLRPGRKYYWRAKADDGVGGETLGTGLLHSNSFTTISDSPNKAWRMGVLGCINGFQQLSTNPARQAANVVSNILNLKLDSMICLGDTYYPDIGSTTGYSSPGTPTDSSGDYAAGAWWNQVKATDDGTLGHFRTNFITTMDAAVQAGQALSYGHLLAAVPTAFMWDDHDRAYDDCGGIKDEVSAALVNKRRNGHQVGHECFMDLNKAFVNQESTRDFDTDTNDGTNTTRDNPQEWFYFDRPPVRFLVLDCRSTSDSKTDADTLSKLMLDDTQETWLFSHIANNPQEYLAICSSLALDGDHGYFEQTANWDAWKGYSFRRDAILNQIWNYGNPFKTFFLTADTHNAHVAVYRGLNNDKPPIYEFMSSNNWFPSAHGWTTGFAIPGTLIGENPSASGAGGQALFVLPDINCITLVEFVNNTIRVSIISTYLENTFNGRKNNRVVYTLDY